MKTLLISALVALLAQSAQAGGKHKDKAADMNSHTIERIAPPHHRHSRRSRMSGTFNTRTP